MKRLILIALFTGLLAPAGLHAQKVYKDANRVILELTEAAGMPKESVTSTKKYTSFSPSASALGANNDHNGSINATVFQKLEIAPHDLASSTGFSSAGGTFSWVNAFNYCKSASNNGTGWRLPTQRELMLIYIFKPALETLFTDSAINGTAFNAILYRSATETDATYSWSVNFNNGATSTNGKTYNYRVRCVREVQ